MPTEAQIRYDEHCKFEDQLIANRLSWLLTSQSILFAGYGVILRGDITRTYQVSASRIFFIVGLTVSLLIFVGILAAVLANLHHKRDLHKEFPDKKIHLGIRAYTTVTGWSVALLLPVVFIIAWLCLPRLS